MKAGLAELEKRKSDCIKAAYCDGSSMSKRAFYKTATGLTEALEIARGNSKPTKLRVPAEIDVRGIRKRLELSQEDFAKEFGFTIHQIRDWAAPVHWTACAPNFLAKPVGEQSDEHDADDREADQLGHVSANERGHGRCSGVSVDGRNAARVG